MITTKQPRLPDDINEIHIVHPERSTVRFVLDGGLEVIVNIREGKLRIEAGRQIIVEPCAANCLKIAPAL